MAQSFEEYLSNIMTKVAEEEFENSPAKDIIRKLVRDCKYWGCTIKMKYDEDTCTAYIYLTVPKDSQLLEDIDGDNHYKPMAGADAAKLIKKRFAEYFSISNTDFVVKYKVDPKIDIWTTESADKRLEEYDKAVKEYDKRKANGEDL